MKHNFKEDFNFITNIFILFILFFGGFIWADTNGIWHRAEDVEPGIFGDDYDGINSNYTFNLDLYLNSDLFVKSKLILDSINSCDSLDTDSTGKIICGFDSVDDADFDSTNELQTLSFNGVNLAISNGNDIPLPIVPVGAVMAFDLNSCPSGWEEYVLAYGVFIRGIDKSGTNIDSDGMRLKGDLQSDSIISHEHYIRTAFDASSGNGNQPNYQISGGDGLYNGYNDRKVWTDTARDLAYTSDLFGRMSSTETRPKNVALLYCRKI